MAAHMLSDDSHERGTIERSALHDMSELEHLRQTVNECKRIIKYLQGELQVATDTINKLQISCAHNKRLTNKVATLRAAVEAEKLRSKRF